MFPLSASFCFLDVVVHDYADTTGDAGYEDVGDLLLHFLQIEESFPFCTGIRGVDLEFFFDESNLWRGICGGKGEIEINCLKN